MANNVKYWTELAEYDFDTGNLQKYYRTNK
jgi:hypothetical protein